MTRLGRGYWLVASAGAAGYSLVASDGVVFSFGQRPTYGSITTLGPNNPIVGFVALPATNQHLLVASDGATFAI